MRKKKIKKNKNKKSTLGSTLDTHLGHRHVYRIHPDFPLIALVLILDLPCTMQIQTMQPNSQKKKKKKKKINKAHDSNITKTYRTNISK